MPQFMLVLRDEGFPGDISAEEIQAIIGRYQEWSARMRGKGEKLRDGEGRVIVRKDGGVSVTDGPYAESREVLGGYFLIEAADYDAAVRLCQDSPHLDFGSIEIREVDVV
jgi:hypothetical protein